MGGAPELLFRSRERGSAVAPRLGNPLYVLACLVAVLVLALGATLFFLADPSSKAGQNPIAVLAVSVVAALLIWGMSEGLRYILAGTTARRARQQLDERLAALERRIDAVDGRLTKYEETVGPQLRTLGSLLHQALSKRDKAAG
jgi:hypothetical protein